MSTTAPSLFSPSTTLPKSEFQATLNARSLVDILYDGFYMLIMLRNRSTPTDAEQFSANVQRFLIDFEKNATKHNFSAEDIFDAKYALCASIDETILSSSMGIRSIWERRPLQLTLFGDQLAGEHFFDKLETARNGGARRVNALEVFHMCLLLGFKGKFLLEGPEKLKYLTAQLGEQIAHIKGKPAQFSPQWAAPDVISNTLKRELPVWIIASVLALLGLIAFTGLDWHAGHTINKALSTYNNIVQLAPRAPTLTITLP
jgi:type VI secretion system protein ImpK